MGSLADQLNRPIKVSIAGTDLLARQINLVTLFDCIMTGMRLSFPNMPETELQELASSKADSSRYPIRSIPYILLEALKPSDAIRDEPIDFDDVEALMGSAKDDNEYLDLLAWATKTAGTPDQEKKKRAAAEKKKKGPRTQTKKKATRKKSSRSTGRKR